MHPHGGCVSMMICGQRDERRGLCRLTLHQKYCFYLQPIRGQLYKPNCLMTADLCTKDQMFAGIPELQKSDIAHWFPEHHTSMRVDRKQGQRRRDNGHRPCLFVHAWLNHRDRQETVARADLGCRSAASEILKGAKLVFALCFDHVCERWLSLHGREGWATRTP